MSRRIRKPDLLHEAMARLIGQPTISIEDWAVLNDVNRNTAFKEAAADRIEGAYRVGNQLRIPSAPWRARFGLTLPMQSDHEQAAA